ncbi:MAG: hypothetical protein A3G75_12340 [Verrucomicrobia bacterium RIFCSPLOWO2_12_FULL_64_8]|nr:MAG: hypothetical protein A3G75_12340 [Verrucomicrobia bacterium RIFCSPLOWO2_12_FULL_64_8]
MKSLRRTHAGFTLIEVALAATILLFGFVGMINAISIGTEMLDTARKQTVAAQIVQVEIDYLRTLDWNSILNLTPTSSTALTDQVAYPEFNSSLSMKPKPAAIVNADTTFQLSRQISDVHGSGSTATLRRVTLGVTWVGNTGRQHTRSCQAYFGKNGLNVSYQKS